MSYAKENLSVRKVPCIWTLLARLAISLGFQLVILGAFGNRPLLPCGKLANNCTAQRSPSLSEDGDSDLYVSFSPVTVRATSKSFAMVFQSKAEKRCERKVRSMLLANPSVFAKRHP
ncbi:hypothetical protein F4803DRAFT_497566 [Xylaria telfairii]|nr:hypothetical protein F4803DRAFT_497566 [Xylaria telfairii]